MEIECISCPPLGTNSFLVTCPNSRKSIVIDPGRGSDRHWHDFLVKKDGWIEEIWLTHSHWDHIADCADLLLRWHCGLLIHEADKANLIEPGIDGLPIPIPISESVPTRCIRDKELLTIGNMHAIVYHTPGHSPGGVCFYFEKEGVLFSGDTLFNGGMGTLALPRTCRQDLMNSLKKLSKLPPETYVYPGHGKPTTIGESSWIQDPEKRFS
ncbi:MAG: MBL fold metallo-hydrolase [Chlamydiota bacterium]|nr:MBL fold metallo-hydrolase [Chlamydiota bacterium]